METTVGEENQKQKSGNSSKMVNISLPLIFADGKPSSLDRMNTGQMEKFIPFLLSCCPSSTSKEAPVWWPSSTSFLFPLRPEVGRLQQWRTVLQEIITRCYEYHQCSHLLRFCQRLADLPEHLLTYKEATQGFISIINSSNKKLIVTYKKKNETYDRPMCSPFKSLLPKRRKPPPQQHIEDIYLCNYCDGEFLSCREIVAHEGVCSGKVDDDGMEALDQVSAMKYLMLQPKGSGTPVVRRCTSLKLTSKAYMSIPISSPLGLKMFVNICPLDNNDKMSCLTRVENFCKKEKESEFLNKKKRSGNYSLRCNLKKKPMIWSHSYVFNKAQRNEKMVTLRTGLNKRARVMLQKCKEAVVLVERLPLLDPLALHVAASLNHLPTFQGDTSSEEPAPESSSTICIDLTCDDESSSNEYSNSSSDNFFLTSTSNHKIPLVENWMSVFPKPLVQVKAL